MSERFAFIIDKSLKLNLYTICRLCGHDNPDKLPIINEEDPMKEVNVDGEPEMRVKIQQLLGIAVTKDDKMPQTMCSSCLDKINDFFEFREMCYATNEQTRKLLGLEEEVAKKPVLHIKPEIYVKEESKVLVNRKRKRKTDEVSDVKQNFSGISSLRETNTVTRKKLRGSDVSMADRKQKDNKCKPKEEIKEEQADVVVVNKAASLVNPKLKQVCKICTQRFTTKGKLQRHQAAQHVPLIPRYHCTACNETIRKGKEIKNHQLWHKLSKTPYICAYCGSTLLNIYSYSRHMRDHAIETPPSLLVLDRVCPQCRQTFVTNFLYNIHLCAVRTHKCAGCSRQLRNDAEYMRHTANCAKAFLNYSKHIPVAEVVAESTVRIKNENDVEAAAAEALSRLSGVSMDMTPIVSLTRLPPPMAANQCVAIPVPSAPASNTASRKGRGKGVSRKDLKRVDELLKSTLDALVSIKHEPEVHVETELHAADEAEKTDNGGDEETENSGHFMDDFHDDSANGEESASASVVNTATTHPSKGDVATDAVIFIKQEVQDECDKEINNLIPDVHIKSEPVDMNYVEDGTGGVGKMPVLKIKIKKEHGTLNSSLVDDAMEKGEKRKKKKKRKDGEKHKEKLDKNQNAQIENERDENMYEDATSEDVNMPNISSAVCIKQEPQDEGYEVAVASSRVEGEQVQGEATVMTSIPLMQFQIASISSGVEFTAEKTTEHTANETVNTPWSNNIYGNEEQQDIKPNRDELDRMLKISCVSSGIDLNAAAGEDRNQRMRNESRKEEKEIGKGKPVNETANTTRAHKPPNNGSPVKKAKTAESTQTLLSAGRSKTMKSTGGVSRTQSSTIHNEMPQIVAVHSGAEVGNFEELSATTSGFDKSAVSGTIVVKAERNRGYADEMVQSTPSESDEQSFISTIDFSNVQIKQEKDIEISAVQLSTPTVNGMEGAAVIKMAGSKKNCVRQQAGKNEDETNSEFDAENEEQAEVEAEESEASAEEQEEVEEREYRELDMPPLLQTEDQLESLKKKSKMNLDATVESLCGTVGAAAEEANFLITNVRSQAEIVATTTATARKKTATVVATSMRQSCGVLKTSALSVEKPNFSSGGSVISGKVSATKEVELNAQPFFDTQSASNEQSGAVNQSPNNSANVEAAREAAEVHVNHIDEAQQNVLNQEVLEQATSAASIVTNAATALSTATNKEETENRMNEHTDAAFRRQQLQSCQLRQPHLLPYNACSVVALDPVLLNDNINEIAENNNNANIERELQDDNIATTMQDDEEFVAHNNDIT